MPRRRPLAICCAFWLTASFASAQSNPNLDRRVDFSCEALPIALALEQLSKTAETPLRAEDVLWNEVVMVRAKNVYLRDLLDRMARMLDAKWSLGSGGYLLSRDSVALQTRWESQAEARAGKLAQTREAIAKVLARPYDPADMARPNGDSSMLARLRDPAVRLLARLLAGPTRAFVLPANKRRMVFATTPTEAQLQLPGDPADALATFGEEIAALRLSEGLPAPAAQAVGAKVALEWRGDQVWATIEALNSQGEVVASGSAAWEYTDLDLLERWAKSPRAARGREPMPANPAWTAAREAVRAGRRPDPKTNLLEACLAPFLDRIAAEQDANFIARAPDDAILLAFLEDDDGRFDPEYFQRILDAGVLFEVRKSGPWLEFQPAHLAAALARRVPRDLVEVFARRFEAFGRIPLTDRAEFAARSPLAAQSRFGRLIAGEPSDALRFYGLLGPAVLTRIANGQRLAVAELPPKARDALREWEAEGRMPLGVGEVSMATSSEPAAFWRRGDVWELARPERGLQNHLFGLGTSRTIRFTFYASAGATSEAAIDLVPPAGGELVAFDALPAPIRAALERNPAESNRVD